ncbi:MAG: diguanylate cyclase [Rubrobacteridae bacterium]|nr:diguanylate cyclase [Rubrobacteridae bacterium]
MLISIPAATFNIASDIPRYFYNHTMNPATINLASITMVLITLAAVDAATGVFIGVRDRINPTNRESSTTSMVSAIKRIPWNTLIFPALLTISIPLTWISHEYRGHTMGEEIIVTISALITMLVIYRSHLFAAENRALSQDIRVDSLTGLFNHRHFHENLTSSITASDILLQPLSLIVFDIDDFAKINSRNGHLHGDAVLAAIGTAVRSKLREGDDAYRIGGDEFAIILPNTNFQTASGLAAQLKSDLQDTIRNHTGRHYLTVSMGISSYPEIAESKDDLFNTADGALYWCKFNGKDNLLVYDSNVVEIINAEDRAKKAEENLLTEMVRSLVSTVDARDSYTHRHSQNVSKLAGKLAIAAGFKPEEVRRIEVAGLLHDIGKIGVPDRILNKPGKLTDKEMQVIMNHPVISAHIVQSSSLKDMAQLIQAHHERWDGNGYPDGLKGEDMPVEARILAIADTYDAMTTDRPYRKGCTVDKALAEIERCSGSQFDPKFSRIFVKMIGHSATKEDSASADFRNRTIADA